MRGKGHGGKSGLRCKGPEVHLFARKGMVVVADHPSAVHHKGAGHLQGVTHGVADAVAGQERGDGPEDVPRTEKGHEAATADAESPCEGMVRVCECRDIREPRASKAWRRIGCTRRVEDREADALGLKLRALGGKPCQGLAAERAAEVPQCHQEDR
jgi:hypothetical protein